MSVATVFVLCHLVDDVFVPVTQAEADKWRAEHTTDELEALRLSLHQMDEINRGLDAKCHACEHECREAEARIVQLKERIAELEAKETA
jgi:hypothetical protein